jgi:hypothetical protein
MRRHGQHVTTHWYISDFIDMAHGCFVWYFATANGSVAAPLSAMLRARLLVQRVCKALVLGQRVALIVAFGVVLCV